MNEKALELGLKNSHFITPHGLDSEEHYTTAYELALIADYALKIDIIREVVKTKTYNVNINGYNKTINNTNELLGYVNGVYGVKTGFTNGAGRCLVTSVERNGFDIITVVLGADTKKMRTKDSINLIEYIYSNYELVDLKEMINEEFEEWQKINKKRIYIYKAKNNNVKIKLDKYKYNFYPVNKQKIKEINIEIQNTNMILEAPIRRNTLIGNVRLKIEEEEIMNIDILIDECIERKGIKEYIVECLEAVI